MPLKSNHSISTHPMLARTDPPPPNSVMSLGWHSSCPQTHPSLGTQALWARWRIPQRRALWNQETAGKKPKHRCPRDTGAGHSLQSWPWLRIVVSVAGKIPSELDRGDCRNRYPLAPPCLNGHTETEAPGHIAGAPWILQAASLPQQPLELFLCLMPRGYGPVVLEPHLHSVLSWDSSLAVRVYWFLLNLLFLRVSLAPAPVSCLWTLLQLPPLGGRGGAWRS